MRIVLVNHCHPQTPHVCATRLREFARVLAARGHRVVLLTETLGGARTAPSPAEVAAQLAEPAGGPVIVACPPKKAAILSAARGGLLPGGVRQGVVMMQYLARGGMFADWRAGARPYVEILAREFRPEIVWASFGNTDCWTIAQALAARTGCPWVADIKDFWGTFIPAPLRRLVAGRYRDAAGWTALSQTHAMEARRWFDADIPVVYSGFDATSIREPNGDTAQGALTLTLTGSTYQGRALEALLAAVMRWVAAQSENVRERLRFVYCGGDRYAVGAVLARLRPACKAEVLGFVPVDELQALHRHAVANLYVNSDRTFHHKVIEMLAARRPILSFPADNKEAAAIAERAGGALHRCATADQVVHALDAALSAYGAPETDGGNDALRSFSWEAQAASLEVVFEDAIRRTAA